MLKRQFADIRRDEFEHAPITLPGDDQPRFSNAVLENEYASAEPSRRAATPRRAVLPPERRSRTALVIFMLTLLLLAGLVGWGITTLRDPHTLPLKAVRIEGSFSHVTTAALQQAVANVVRGNILNVDVTNIRQAAQTLPWVHQVTVQRVWPDTLRIKVVEQTAVARWSDQGLLNSDGELFAPDLASYPAGLPELRGPQGMGASVLAQYRSLNKLIASLNLQIVLLELNERRAWRIHLSNGLEILLGRTDSYARLLRFVQLYKAALAAQAANITRVDLRYSNGLTVRMKSRVDQK